MTTSLSIQRHSEAELHFVHYNTKCGRSLTEALTNCPSDPEALAVLGVLIEEGHENPHFDPILNGVF